MEAFREGFNDVVPISHIKIFDEVNTQLFSRIFVLSIDILFLYFLSVCLFMCIVFGILVCSKSMSLVGEKNDTGCHLIVEL